MIASSNVKNGLMLIVLAAVRSMEKENKEKFPGKEKDIRITVITFSRYARVAKVIQD